MTGRGGVCASCSTRLSILAGGRGGQLLTQLGGGVEQPLGGAADLSDGAGLLRVQRARFGARLNETTDGLLGDADRLLRGRVHGSPPWECDGVMWMRGSGVAVRRDAPGCFVPANGGGVSGRPGAGCTVPDGV